LISDPEFRNAGLLHHFCFRYILKPWPSKHAAQTFRPLYFIAAIAGHHNLETMQTSNRKSQYV